MAKKELQWHPGFQAALQVELEEERPYLKFHKEYNLSEMPLQIDALIIKADSRHRVRKSIGKIFRRYNIIEYKSPDDYISVNNFYKVLAYACIYQSNTAKVLEIHPQDITITFVCSHLPQELIKHLKTQYKASVKKMWDGIFYIEGLMFPTQILITNRLPKNEYIWLSRLRGGLGLREDIEPLARVYKEKKNDPLYEAVMNLIICANQAQYKKGVKTMCDALMELFADELAEREERGIERGSIMKLVSLVRRKQQKGASVNLIAEILEENVELIQRIYQCLIECPEYSDEEICKRL